MYYIMQANGAINERNEMEDMAFTIMWRLFSFYRWFVVILYV
jgi:hypothetical protein